jgi:hypothetical protein
MKRLVLFIAVSFLLSSCVSNYGKEIGKKEDSLKEKGGVTASCKPQREILVKGKCIKRRKYM